MDAKEKLSLLKQQVRLAHLEVDYEGARDRLHSDPRQENIDYYKATGNLFQKARKEYRMEHVSEAVGEKDAIVEPVPVPAKVSRFKRWFGGS